MPIDNNEKNGNNFAETVRLKNEEKKANDEYASANKEIILANKYVSKIKSYLSGTRSGENYYDIELTYDSEYGTDTACGVSQYRGKNPSPSFFRYPSKKNRYYSFVGDIDYDLMISTIINDLEKEGLYVVSKKIECSWTASSNHSSVRGYAILFYIDCLGSDSSTREDCMKKSKITGSTGGCYIATCVYGSYDCPQVWTLRRFRDTMLASSFFGRAFIKAYYAISPTLVKWFGNTKPFQLFWRRFLDRMVNHLHKIGVEDTKYYD